MKSRKEESRCFPFLKVPVLDFSIQFLYPSSTMHAIFCANYCWEKLIRELSSKNWRFFPRSCPTTILQSALTLKFVKGSLSSKKKKKTWIHSNNKRRFLFLRILIKILQEVYKYKTLPAGSRLHNIFVEKSNEGEQ